MRFEQDESKPIVGFMPDHSDQVGLEGEEGINLFGEAVRGELWGRCGRLPISASITRPGRPRTCSPDVGREEGGCQSCQMHPTCESTSQCELQYNVP